MLLYGADKDVAAWVAGQFNVEPSYLEPCTAIGVVKEWRIVAGVVYNNYKEDAFGAPLSIEMTIASVDKTWFTRQNIGAFFRYPFIQLNLKRIWTQCSAEDEGVKLFNQRLGFKQEGINRNAWAFGGDSVCFGLIKEECKWL